MEFERRKKIKEPLNIAPLVDTVFNLLIFFLLTSQFIKPQGLKVELPRAKYSRPQDRQDIVVAITKKGNIYLNGLLIPVDKLPQNLMNLIQKQERKIVIIKADKNVKLQFVVDVMDIAKRCNAKGVTISTKLKEK